MAVLALGALVGDGGQGPADEIAARRLVLERAASADASLADLSSALGPALDAARRGSAGLVADDPSPGTALLRAAEEVAAAETVASRARRALDGLRGALAAHGVPHELTAPAAAGELASIAAQLEGTAAAADAFAVQRDRATAVVQALGDALASVDEGDRSGAEVFLAQARAEHERLATWDSGLATFPVWLETSGALIEALERLLRVAAEGDDAATEAAAREVATVAAEAATADRALRIAIAEGAAGVAQAPVARLADVMREVVAARSAMASILQTVAR